MPYALAGRLKGVVLDLLFPPRCVGCGSGGGFLCQRCLGPLPRITPPICLQCGKPVPAGDRCPGCWGVKLTIDGIRSAFRFEGTIRQAIHDFKYRNLRALARPLADLLAAHLSASAVPGDVIVAVPLHPGKLRERGYNQSLMLAEGLGQAIGLPVDYDTLVRVRNSPPQARTDSVEARRQNVSRAFAARGRGLKGKGVLLVDDVCTSGATLDACALALKRSGASSVWGLTLARET